MRIPTRLRDYLILFLFSLLPFWRFSWSTKGIFNPSDFNFPLHVDYIFKAFLFTWNPDFGSGFDITANYRLLDILGPWRLLNLLGFSLAQIQIIYFVGIYFLLGWGMYFFVTNFFNFKNQVVKSLAGITSGLFYMFNFCSFQFTMGAPHILISFALFPVLLIFLTRILPEKNFLIQLRWAILFGLVSFFFLPVDLPHSYLYSFIFLIFIIIYSFIMRLDWKIITRGISLILLFVILLNIWWTLPFWESMFRGGMAAQVVMPEYNRIVLESMNRALNVFEILRLTITRNQFGYKEAGVFAWPAPIRNFYRSPFSLIFFVILLSLMLYTLRDKRYFKKLLTLSMLGVMGIGLSWGAHGPFFIWRIFLWCFNHIPGFTNFRNFTKFRVIALFWYASMFGILISLIYERLSTILIRRKVLPVILVLGALLIVLLNSPQYLGGNLGGSMTFFQPPDYYSQANQWLNSQGPYFRTLTLPPEEILELYEWGPHYNMASIVQNAFARPMLVKVYTPQTKEIMGTFANEEEEIKTPFAGKIMKLLGIRFIMTRNDLLATSLGDTRILYLENLPLELARQKNISLEKQFDRLRFYRNHYYEPNHIYSSPGASLIAGGLSTLVPLSYTTLLDEKSAIFFTKQIGKGEKAAELLERVDRVIITQSVEDLIEELVGDDEQLIEKCREILKAKKIEYLFYREEEEPFIKMNLEVPRESIYDLRIIIATKGPSLREDTSILKIDGKHYLLKEFSKERIWKRESMLKREGIFLGKGRHSLEIVAPRGIEVRIVSLESEQRRRKKRESPVEFTRINPTRYHVKLRADQPCWLIFSESFSGEWKAYVRSARQPVSPSVRQFEWSALVSAWRDREKRTELKEHFTVNGYANAWYIPVDQLTSLPVSQSARQPVSPSANELERRAESRERREKKQSSNRVIERKEKGSEMEVVVESMPQRFFEGGTAISGLTLIFCLTYLVAGRVRRSRSARKD